MKIVIIGGGTAGISTATKLRRLDEQCEIVVLDKNDTFAVGKCSMPYYMSGEIDDAESFIGADAEMMADQYNIKVITGARVEDIDRKAKLLKLKDGDNIEYDKLVIATGASPIRPDIEGILSENVFMLGNLDNLKSIKEYIEQNQVQNVAVIGGGLIGLEMAEAFYNLDLNVSLIDMSSHIFPAMDADMAAILQNLIRKKGIEIYLNERVTKFENKIVWMASGKTLPYDMALVAAGVRPDIDLAVNADLETGDRGGIVVNEHLQTSDSDIYALGDVIEIKNKTTGKMELISSASIAVKQAKIVAENLAGKRTRIGEFVGTAISPLFDYTVAAAGANEKQLQAANLDYLKMHLYGTSSAGIIEESALMLFKLLFDRDGKILGVQGIGEKGIDKRIDVIVNIMKKDGTIADLENAEMAYTPAYGSAQDAVNNLGSLSSEIAEGSLRFAFFEDVEADDSLLLDVRSKAAYHQGHIDNALNIPAEQIRSSLESIPRNSKVILYCNRGHNAYKMFCILRNNGFENAYVLSGGMTFYNEILNNQKAEKENI